MASQSRALVALGFGDHCARLITARELKSNKSALAHHLPMDKNAKKEAKRLKQETHPVSNKHLRGGHDHQFNRNALPGNPAREKAPGNIPVC